MVPVLIEQRTDQFGDYTVEWMVDPPAQGQAHMVIEETWTREYTVRTIHAWEPA